MTICIAQHNDNQSLSAALDAKNFEVLHTSIDCLLEFLNLLNSQTNPEKLQQNLTASFFIISTKKK